MTNSISPLEVNSAVLISGQPLSRYGENCAGKLLVQAG
jgi:hypothetical protein